MGLLDFLLGEPDHDDGEHDLDRDCEELLDDLAQRHPAPSAVGIALARAVAIIAERLGDVEEFADDLFAEGEICA